MNQDVFLTRWKHFRKELSYQWTHLTSEEIDDIGGRRAQLVLLLENRYGYARGRAEREAERFVQEFEGRLHRAS